jgi:hypothetical protein
VIPLFPYPSRWTSQWLPLSRRQETPLSFKHTTLELSIGPMSQWLWQMLRRAFPESPTSILRKTVRYPSDLYQKIAQELEDASKNISGCTFIGRPSSVPNLEEI